MRQRLGVARSLLTDPELLILDEPSNGLDPAGMAEFRQMIRSFVEEDGRTVFISSHLLDEVEKIADDIAIVQAGVLVAHGGQGKGLELGGVSVERRLDGRRQGDAEVERLAVARRVAVEQLREARVVAGEHGDFLARGVHLAQAMQRQGFA